jgi:hypothetical protein
VIELTVQSRKDSSTRALRLPRKFEAIANPVKFRLATTPDGR